MSADTHTAADATAAAPPAALLPKIRSALFEIAEKDPEGMPRVLLWSICVLFAALLIWAIFAKLDIVAVAEGRLIPETYVKVVQPAEAGIVREILVQEGQRVAKGAVLVRLDPTIASADRRSVGAQLALKRLELRRIEAQLSGKTLTREAADDPLLLAQVRLDAAARERAHLDQLAQEEATLVRHKAELAAAQETLEKLERTLPSYQQSAQAYEKLAREKLVGALTAEEKKREALEHAQDAKAQLSHVASLAASISAQQNKVLQLKSAYRSVLQSERIEVLAEANRLQEEAGKQGFREGLLELRAPQDGVVKELATTTLGAVVQPGAVLLTLVPQEEPLLAEVYVRNEDVGFVKEGQAVRLKLAAYPFTKYGMLEGTVQTLSADASRLEAAATSHEDPSSTATESSQSLFKAIVALGEQNLHANGLRLPVVAGMQVQAEIRQGRRTVLEYLLSPVQRVMGEAGMER